MGSVLSCCQIEEARFVPEEEIVCINSSDLLFPPVDLSPWRPEHTKGHRETEKPARNAKKHKQIKKTSPKLQRIGQAVWKRAVDVIVDFDGEGK